MALLPARHAALGPDGRDGRRGHRHRLVHEPHRRGRAGCRAAQRDRHHHRDRQPGAPDGLNRRDGRHRRRHRRRASPRTFRRSSTRRRSPRSSCGESPPAVQAEVAQLYGDVLAPVFVALALDLCPRHRRGGAAPEGTAVRRARTIARARIRTRSPRETLEEETSMSHHPTIAVVGSGPIGSAYARLAARGHPGRPRRHVRGRPAADRAARRERAQHRRPRREGAGARAVAGAAGGGVPRVARHPVRHRRGGHVHRSPGHAPPRLRRRGLGARADVPRRGRRDQRRRAGRALDVRDPATGVQREGAVHRRRRVGRARSRPRRDCCTRRARRSRTPPSAAASARCSRRSSRASCPRATAPSTLPVAGDPQPDGTMRWAGADFVLGPLIEPGNPLAERFELRDLTLVRRVEHDGDRRRPASRSRTCARRRRRSCRPTSSWSPPTRSAPRSCCGRRASARARSGTTSRSIRS